MRPCVSGICFFEEPSDAIALHRVMLEYHSMRTELVTNLKRHAYELLSDIERDKEPILITRHGLPSAYLVDVESFELMQQRISVLDGIAGGEQGVAEGRVATQDEARAHLARWL